MRNPYLVLGIDYGTPLGEAKRAFARAARELKRGASRRTIERADLSSALNEVEREMKDPEADVRFFRVPANPSLYEPTGAGLFRPRPYLPQRETERPAGRPSRDAVHVPTPFEVLGSALVDALQRSTLPDPYPQLKEKP